MLKSLEAVQGSIHIQKKRSISLVPQCLAKGLHASILTLGGNEQ